MKASEKKVNSCPEFPYFGAKYPDARCVDGYLHDMDKCDDEGNLYLMNESYPCPFCNKEEFMQEAINNEAIDNEADLQEVENWIESIKQKYN
jgi:hypothetical protein